uniref:Synaptotagmin VIIa n=1 Tax=Gasterosteus aculeatus aculeatus TaxID=481459 RepID=A0AAQ4QFF1_GASAC
MYLNREENNSKGSVSLSVFLVSVAVTVCAVWLVALCGVCGWCQRKLGKRNKPGVETADAPDSAHGRGEKKGINSDPCCVASMRSLVLLTFSSSTLIVCGLSLCLVSIRSCVVTAHAEDGALTPRCLLNCVSSVEMTGNESHAVCIHQVLTYYFLASPSLSLLYLYYITLLYEKFL